MHTEHKHSVKFVHALHEARHAAIAVKNRIGLRLLVVPANDDLTVDWKARLYYEEPCLAIRTSKDLMREYMRARIMVSMASYLLDVNPLDIRFSGDSGLVLKLLSEHFSEAERAPVRAECESETTAMLKDGATGKAIDTLATYLDDNVFAKLKPTTCYVQGAILEHILIESLSARTQVY